MMFCPKCGSLMMPKKIRNKQAFACSCGYVKKDVEDVKMTETIEKEKEIEVVDKEIETRPLIDEECPKCGHGKARYWTIQTRASDEPETKFLRCEKCKHTWRDYS